MSQFLFQTPAGYLYDYTEHKVLWLSCAAVLTTMLTVFTAAFATENGGNLTLMIIVKFIQGAVTSFIPPGLNSITQGIVGAAGMTVQVAANEMANHLGTSILVLTGSLLGVALYPNLELLFIVSPIACAGVIFFLMRIRSEDIDHDEARGLTKEEKTKASSVDYAPPASAVSDPDASEPAASDPRPPNTKHFDNKPSFNFGWSSISDSLSPASGEPHAESPLKVLRDPILLTFIMIVFLFHTANGTVLPLVMQVRRTFRCYFCFVGFMSYACHHFVPSHFSYLPST